jgi:O-antigen biosynthesis protein
VSHREHSDADAERYVPESHGALIAQEHLHRYALAAALLRGRRVLDVGSGAGYGTALLRAQRNRVVALDLARAAARRAAPAVCGSAVALPFGDATFDAVVCFEMIEHVPAPERVLDEIARVLAPNGIALVSTPDRAVFTDRAGNRNPHHLRELDRGEFAALLAERFAARAIYGQSLWAGSWLARLDERGAPPRDAVRRVRALDVPTDSHVAAASWVDPTSDALPTPLYLVALCAHEAAVLTRFERKVGADQLLHDRAQRILGEHVALAEAIAARDREIASAAAHAENLRSLLRERDARLAALETHAKNVEERHGERAARVAALEAHAANLEARIGEGRERVTELERDVAGHAAHARNVETLLGQAKDHAVNVEQHAANLEQRVRDIEHAAAGHRAHAANLERRVAEAEAHAGNVEKVAAELRARVEALEAHIQNLERAAAADREARLAEAGGLRTELAEARARVAALDAELGEARASLAFLRSTRWQRAGRRLGLAE